MSLVLSSIDRLCVTFPIKPLKCASVSIVRVLYNSGRLFLRKGPAPIGEGGGARAQGDLA